MFRALLESFATMPSALQVVPSRVVVVLVVVVVVAAAGAVVVTAGAVVVVVGAVVVVVGAVVVVVGAVIVVVGADEYIKAFQPCAAEAVSAGLINIMLPNIIIAASESDAFFLFNIITSRNLTLYHYAVQSNLIRTQKNLLFGNWLSYALTST